MKSKIFAASVLTLLLTGLTSCSQNSSPKTNTLNIYQASSLSLKAGTKVQTEEGVYNVQQDEIWHSDKRYRDLERKLFAK